MAKSNSIAISQRHPGPPIKNELGNVYGRLTVLKRSPKGPDGWWVCRCECGNIATISGRNLRNGNSTACNNQCRRKAKQGLLYPRNLIPEYGCWRDMKQRCYNKYSESYANYGGRGVEVCEKWRESFDAFFRDMGPRPSPKHSINRKDNNGNYEPSNCHWATKHQQDNNRRTNHLLIHNGQTLSIAQWSRVVGLKERTLRGRLECGWSIEKAITAPVRLY